MSHRANFRVFKSGKTIKWNFAAPLVNVQQVMRINYTMSHWLRRILNSFNIKIFKFFYSLAYEFPFIKIIGYRKVYARSKTSVSSNKISLKSSYLQKPENLLLLPGSAKSIAKLKYLRQRVFNRKLVPVLEISKNRKASYNNYNFPLVTPQKAYNNLFNYYLLEAQSSLNFESSRLSASNYVFNNQFLFNSFVLFSLFGAVGSDSSRARLNSTFRGYLYSLSFTAQSFKQIAHVESDGWLKFFFVYLHNFFFSKNSELSSLEISSGKIDQFFLLKKAFFIIKLIIKNFPRKIFLKNNDLCAVQNSSTLLSLIKFYISLTAAGGRRIDSHDKGRLLIPTKKKFTKVSSFIASKYKLILVFASLFDRKDSKTRISLKLKPVLAGFLKEIGGVWSRNYGENYFCALNKFQISAQFSTQNILFLSKPNCFDPEIPFFFAMQNFKHANLAVNNLLLDFKCAVRNKVIFNYFSSLRFFVLKKDFYNSVAKTVADFSKKREKRVYVRPVKMFFDIDKTFNLKIPHAYKDLLKMSSKASSTFTFTAYEEILKKNSFNQKKKIFSGLVAEKLFTKLQFIYAELTNEGRRLKCAISSKRNLLAAVSSVLNCYILCRNEIKSSSDNFVYLIEIFTMAEKALNFYKISRQDTSVKKEFVDKFNLKAAIVLPGLRYAQILVSKFENLYARNFLSEVFVFSGPSEVNGFNEINNLQRQAVILKNSNSIVLAAVKKTQDSLSADPLGVILKSDNAFDNSLFYFSSNSSFTFFKVLLRGSIKSGGSVFNKFFETEYISMSTLHVFKNFSPFAPSNKKKNAAYFKDLIVMYLLNKNYRKFSAFANKNIFEPAVSHYEHNGIFNLTQSSFNKLNSSSLIDINKPLLNAVSTKSEFLVESVYLLRLSSSFFKIFGVAYEIIFYPIQRVFQDNARFQFLVSQADAFLKAYVSRNPYVLYWLNEFILVFYAAIATKSTKALCRFIADRFKREYYWNQPMGFMFSVIRSLMLHEFKISGLRIGFHGKFGGQDRAYRLYKIWGLNPCLRNGYLTGSYSSVQCRSRYGITDIHVWLTYF